ncbi:MAG: ATP-binding cassette domain-containing protein [Phycisphaerae bacterium]|nr:ATP-binding cassette domain-containing protein [Phycisphaerae bacterium]
MRYLWPYRRRLAVAIVCAVIVAVLWGGGFGLIMPGLKILLADEGLHGWAWQSLVEDRLDIKLVRRLVPASLRIDGEQISMVIDVNRVSDDGVAAKAGIAANEWLVGIDDEQKPDHRVMRADELARELAHMAPGGRVRLRVFDQQKAREAIRVVEVVLDREDFQTRLLGRIARVIPEPEGGEGRYTMLVWLLWVFLAATLIRNVLRYIQDYLVQTAVLRACMDIRCENYGITLRLPLTYFSQKGVSDTMSRFIADTGELARGQSTLFGKTVVEPAKAIVCIVLAFWFSWRLTLMGLTVGPVVFVLIRMFGRVMKRASRKALEGWSRMLGALEGTLTGIRVVKAYTMEGHERRRFFRVNRAVYKQQRRMARIDSATSPIVEGLGMIAGMAAGALAGYWVLVDETMDVDLFLTWMALLGGMFDPIRKLSKVITRFHRADAAATRVFELHDQEQEKRLPGAPNLPRHSRDLELRNVSFRYPTAADDALKDISLRIEAGRSVALVGPNGSGKTTLVSMVPRLFDPARGAVLIDGKDVSRYSLHSLRSQIAVVTQDTVLFNATIAENIAYGQRSASRDAVLSAAKRAFVDEFVDQMPDGYDTMVGEHGATLSGGQKQRITIARAILRNPAILIFDEAMSQVDADSERRIHEALDEFVKDRTTLIVAHRFATVLSADRIVVMEDGGIIDSGAHDDLLGRCELYRTLYQTQFIDTGGIC